MPARLLEPVADEIGLRRDATAVGRGQSSNVVLTELSNQPLVAEEWWVADYDVRLRPIRFRAVRRHDRVAALDGVEGLQNWVSRFREAVAPHPLDFADPDRHAGEFGRVRVQLDPLDVGRSDSRKLSLEAVRFPLKLHAVFEVLERLQCEIEEIP